MKKALLLVLVVVFVFALAAPAFAVDLPWMGTGYQARITVLPALELSLSNVHLQFGSAAPGTTVTGGLTATVKSNDAFHKAFKYVDQGSSFNNPVVADHLLGTTTAKIDGADYVLGTVLDRSAALSDVENIALSITPEWDDAVGVHQSYFWVAAWQD